MTRYRLAVQAVDDLQDIWDYLGVEKDNPSAARRQIEALREKFRMLAGSPLLGEACDQLQPGMRFFTAGNYVIFYSHEGGRIDIERVIHGARNIEALFGKR